MRAIAQFMSVSKWLGCMEAITCSWRKRAKSSGATTCACSMRKRKPPGCRSCGAFGIFFLDVALGRRECLQRHGDAAVADGVKAHLEAGRGALRCHLIERRLLELRQAGILRLVGVRRQHGRRVRAERAVHEALQHAGVQHRVLRRMEHAVLLQDVQRLRETAATR